MDRNAEYLNKHYNTKCIIKRVYLNEKYDWIVGFSGGKDSTVLVQIILESLLEIENKNYNNKIYIVSSDTLIENPIVLKQLNTSLDLIDEFCKKYKLPIVVKKVKPDLSESFWVNLIGRGYPLPNQSFRWCTDRLKIKPMESYLDEIKKTCKKEILTVLGVRKGESLSRDIKLDKSEINDSLFRKNSVNGNYIFSPIENFSLFDIWKYLGDKNIDFFNNNNMNLSILYEDSSVGLEECPSNLDDKLKKGCGNSRWGCWLCPVVTQDKSLEGFINSGQNWLQPLLDFRTELMKGRDLSVNRYNASLRISKQKKFASLVKFRYIDLKTKNNYYFLPKKEGREELKFGKLSIDGKTLENDSRSYNIISEDDYKLKVNNHLINPYSESDINIHDFVIKLNKNVNNDKISVVGFGPYTLKYRFQLLNRIIKLREEMIKYDIEIISDEEILLILDILEIVHNSLLNEGYLELKKPIYVKSLNYRLEEIVDARKYKWHT